MASPGVKVAVVDVSLVVGNERTACDEGTERDPLPEHVRAEARAKIAEILAKHPNASVRAKQRLADKVMTRYEMMFELEGLKTLIVDVAIDAKLSDAEKRGSPAYVTCTSCRGRGAKQGGTCALCGGSGTTRWSAARLWERWDDFDFRVAYASGGPHARLDELAKQAARYFGTPEAIASSRSLVEETRALLDLAIQLPSRQVGRRKARSK